jgi:hypothetical protein
MKATLEKWIPVVLAAQEPDGYLQTAYTLPRYLQVEKQNGFLPQGETTKVMWQAISYRIAINHYTLLKVRTDDYMMMRKS